ncbi:unnamed protein product [Effrenium voratum]|nr:unnamed protein product [Effrenium voratum]
MPRPARLSAAMVACGAVLHRLWPSADHSCLSFLWAEPDQYVRWLGSGGNLPVKLAGGKAAVLHQLAGWTDLGARVPQGLVVLTPALQEALGGMESKLPSAPEDLPTSLSKIRAFLTEPSPLPQEVQRALLKLRASGRRFAVRSSAIHEDSELSAFAGLFRTKLHVKPDGLEAALREVWASAFTPEVFANLQRHGLGVQHVAVLIQPMVAAWVSGVAFSRNPKQSRGGHGSVAVSAGGGAGAVVDGAADAEDFAVDRISWEVRRYSSDGQVSEQDARRVAKLAVQLEEQLQMEALDIEFAIDAQGEIFLLQARPDTAFPWRPPSPGRWIKQKELVCVPRGPLAPLCQQPVLAGLDGGLQVLSAKYAAPMEFRSEVVNGGFVYRKAEDRRMSLFWWVCSALPQIRRVVLTRSWEAEIESWPEVKRSLLGSLNTLKEAQLSELSDDMLLGHIQSCVELLQEATLNHRRFSGVMASFLYLLHFSRLHAVNEAQLLKLLEQSAAETHRSAAFSAAGAGIQALLAALDEKSMQRIRSALGQGEDIIGVLDGIAGSGTPATQHAQRLLQDAKFWVLGADIMSPTVYEEKTWLAAEVTRGLELRAELRSRGTEELGASEIEAQVPAEHRAEFLRLFHWAVQAAPIREDRFVFHHEATALLRWAVLEAGSRVPGAGQETEMALAAPSVEVLKRAMAGDQEAQKELAESHRMFKGRSQMSDADVPAELPIPKQAKHLRGPWLPGLSAALGWLPFFQGSSWAVALEMIVDWRRLDDGGARHEGSPAHSSDSEGGSYKVLSGTAVQDECGVVKGIARVGPEGLQEGEILIVHETSEAFVQYFSKIKAIVTETGGILSHAAVNAREYKLPCLISVKGACAIAVSGQEVQIDCRTGELALLG